MALVRYGGGIIQMSGSIAGNTFARNRYGNYIRARIRGVNPQSDRQVVARATIAMLAEMWHEDLTQEQRDLWAVYANAISMVNRLGEAVKLSGFNHFIRSNGVAHAFGQGLASDAPTILSLPEQDPTVACTEEDIAAQTFTITCNTTGWHPNGDGKVALGIYQGIPVLDGRNFFGGPWRLMDVFDTTEGAAGTATFDAAFAFAEGQKVWFQARVVTLSKRVSSIWKVPYRTIEAD